jgi:hypothetical protein
MRVEPDRLFTANAQEVERIQGGPGAVILLAEGLPLPFEGYELYPPAVRYTRKAHAMGGFVEGDKLFWVDTFVNAALGELDFIELNCNHFLPRQVDTDLAPWSHWRIEFGYRGNRGFALWMMDLYYRILNSGIQLPLSAGSANGSRRRRSATRGSTSDSARRIRLPRFHARPEAGAELFDERPDPVARSRWTVRAG